MAFNIWSTQHALGYMKLCLEHSTPCIELVFVFSQHWGRMQSLTQVRQSSEPHMLHNHSQASGLIPVIPVPTGERQEGGEF